MLCCAVTRQKIAESTALRMRTPEMRERMRIASSKQQKRPEHVVAHVTHLLRLRYGTKLQSRWIHRRNRHRPSYASIGHACFNNAQGKVAVVACSRPTWSRELRWTGYAYRRCKDTGELISREQDLENMSPSAPGPRGVRFCFAVQFGARTVGILTVCSYRLMRW
jgi:hypothetical protein